MSDVVGREVIAGLEALLRVARNREKELLQENEKLARALAEAPSDFEERAAEALETIAASLMDEEGPFLSALRGRAR